MNWAYDMMEMERERGYASSDKYICGECLNDEYLKHWIENHEDAEIRECDYCHTHTFCIPMNTFMEKLFETIKLYYSDVNNECIPFDNEESDYIVTTYDNEEIIADFVEADENVLNDILDLCYEKTWCKKNALGETERELKEYSWKHFSNIVKQKNRYFFQTPTDKDCYGLMSPDRILDIIAYEAEKLGLIKTMPEETSFYRAQSISTKELENKLEDTRFGSPPHELAAYNRMNADGISVFYASDNQETSISEIEKRSGEKIVIAEFQNINEIRYLDLSAINKIPIPSSFNTNKFDDRERLIFYKILKIIVKLKLNYIMH